MQKSDTYLIEWYGPFFSKEELKKWEDTRSDKFNLYVFQAKQTGKSDKYYCGMTIRQTVGKRLKNNDHHIHDYENRQNVILQIWIGTITIMSQKVLWIWVIQLWPMRQIQCFTRLPLNSLNQMKM